MNPMSLGTYLPALWFLHRQECRQLNSQSFSMKVSGWCFTIPPFSHLISTIPEAALTTTSYLPLHIPTPIPNTTPIISTASLFFTAYLANMLIQMVAIPMLRFSQLSLNRQKAHSKAIRMTWKTKQSTAVSKKTTTVELRCSSRWKVRLKQRRMSPMNTIFVSQYIEVRILYTLQVMN